MSPCDIAPCTDQSPWRPADEPSDTCATLRASVFVDMSCIGLSKALLVSRFSCPLSGKSVSRLDANRIMVSASLRRLNASAAA